MIRARRLTKRQHLHPLKGKVYDIKRDWLHKTEYNVRITRIYRQRFRDITP